MKLFKKKEDAITKDIIGQSCDTRKIVVMVCTGLSAVCDIIRMALSND